MWLFKICFSWVTSVTKQVAKCLGSYLNCDCKPSHRKSAQLGRCPTDIYLTHVHDAYLTCGIGSHLLVFPGVWEDGSQACVLPTSSDGKQIQYTVSAEVSSSSI